MENKGKSKLFLCPSSAVSEGSRILGVKQQDGTIGILPIPIKLNHDFNQNCISQNINPIEHFRFVNNCIDSKCRQWINNKCSITAKALSVLNMIPIEEHLPKCGIRSDCRWYKQERASACKFCKYIITDMSNAI
nr:hypothetical protein [Mucilaginibacter sp. X5P1]